MDGDVNILVWIIIGLLCGWLVSAMLKDWREEILGALLVGSLGALAGGFFSSAAGEGDVFATTAAFLGAIAALVVVRMLLKSRPAI